MIIKHVPNGWQHWLKACPLIEIDQHHFRQQRKQLTLYCKILQKLLFAEIKVTTIDHWIICHNPNPNDQLSRVAVGIPYIDRAAVIKPQPIYPLPPVIQPGYSSGTDFRNMINVRKSLKRSQINVKGKFICRIEFYILFFFVLPLILSVF